MFKVSKNYDELSICHEEEIGYYYIWNESLNEPIRDKQGLFLTFNFYEEAEEYIYKKYDLVKEEED